MEYIIALALLVAVGGWVVAAYTRLEQLYRRAQGAWERWNAATQQRNDCLGDFVAVFASFLPREDMLPRDMRKWAEDSQRELTSTPKAPLQGTGKHLSNAEYELRRMIRSSGHAMETEPRMKESEQLLGLYQAMAVSRSRQEEVAQFYKRSAHDYNIALNEPLTRFLAPVLGFSPLDELETISHRFSSTK